mmetsp:Transcript_22072/g.89506  ORF Transcript_22072/g.89506 Transcript_22072/m.89506 type:complete len:107 (-) Transcript_22072:420-740(-)
MVSSHAENEKGKLIAGWGQSMPASWIFSATAYPKAWISVNLGTSHSLAFPSTPHERHWNVACGLHITRSACTRKIPEQLALTFFYSPLIVERGRGNLPLLYGLAML